MLNLQVMEIAFQVTLHEIREEVLPPLDDVFAKKAGQYESLDDLKKVITGKPGAGLCQTGGSGTE